MMLTLYLTKLQRLLQVVIAMYAVCSGFVITKLASAKNLNYQIHLHAVFSLFEKSVAAGFNNSKYTHKR